MVPGTESSCLRYFSTLRTLRSPPAIRFPASHTACPIKIPFCGSRPANHNVISSPNRYPAAYRKLSFPSHSHRRLNEIVKNSSAGIQDSCSRIPYHRIPYPRVRKSCLPFPVKSLFTHPIFRKSPGANFCSIHHTSQKAS